MNITKNKIIFFLCLTVLAISVKCLSDSLELNKITNDSSFKEKALLKYAGRLEVENSRIRKMYKSCNKILNVK